MVEAAGIEPASATMKPRNSRELRNPEKARLQFGYKAEVAGSNPGAASKRALVSGTCESDFGPRTTRGPSRTDLDGGERSHRSGRRSRLSYFYLRRLQARIASRLLSTVASGDLYETGVEFFRARVIHPPV